MKLQSQLVLFLCLILSIFLYKQVVSEAPAKVSVHTGPQGIEMKKRAFSGNPAMVTPNITVHQSSLNTVQGAPNSDYFPKATTDSVFGGGLFEEEKRLYRSR